MYSYENKTEQIVRVILLAAGIAGIYATPNLYLGTPLQAQTELQTADYPRALSNALDAFERRCHCVVTFEEPEWRTQQLIDITDRVRSQSRSGLRLRIPNDHAFSFSLDGTDQGDTRRGAALQGIIEAFARSGNPGEFRAVTGNRLFHVIPRGGSILDTRVSTLPTEGTILQTVRALLTAVSSATGKTVGLASGPVNLMQRQVRAQATNEPAQDVLARVLQSSGVQVSWRMYYDYGMRVYLLNIHPVR